MVYKSRKKKSNHRFLKILAVVLFVGTFFFFVNRNYAEANFEVPNNPTSQSSELPWWDGEFAYRRKIDITSNNKGIVEFNHAQLSIESKSNTDGSDLRVIGNSDNKFTEIPFEYAQFDQVSTKLAFDPSTYVYDSYFLYYGNKGEYGNINDKSKQAPMTGISSTFTLREEERSKIVISAQKKWLLTDSSDSSAVEIKVSSNETLSSDVYYFFEGDDKKHKAEVMADSFTVDFSERKPGATKLFIATYLNDKIERSNSITFKVSKPIYIAWTLDWEGVDPGQENLEMVSDIASDYSIKITHFFNPRILISLKIPSPRKKELVNWVLQRHNNLDEEIAMHLHMHHDMVEESGVKAKYEAKTWDKGVSGYDTPSTEYSYAEYVKILQWGINKMQEVGLPAPEGFRAGGWFANLETLRAMQDVGFEYDSSARLPFPIGQNKVPQTWDTTSRTQPYMISQVDQSSDSEPTLDLMEMPNNGLDSYWSDTDDLIKNFYDNYTPGTTADNSRLVTYLSHPEWFNIDDPKLRELYNELNKYRIDFDNGPVKFVTLSEWRELNN